MMDANDRVVVIGASGQLGTELMTVFGERAVAVARAAVDLEVPATILAMLARYGPSVVVNTAAFHNVEICETHPDRAFAVNALAVDRLAAACTVAGTRLVHVSTDYVFAGDAGRPYEEDDAANPRNAYGASKLAGEHLVRRHGDRHAIVRTSGLYGRAGSSVKGYTFVERVLGQAERGERIRVVTDVTFSPSYAVDVAHGIRAIVDAAIGGTFHVTNAGSCTWFAFAEAAIAEAGLRATVEPTTSDVFPSWAKRPANSALAHGALERAGLPAMRSWREGLRAYVASRT
jgi:dTDP-4-dehydrorhamnose reductase